jgi:hypothetical protein
MPKVRFVPEGYVRASICLGTHISVNMSKAKGTMSMTELRYTCFEVRNFEHDVVNNRYSYLIPNSLLMSPEEDGPRAYEDDFPPLINLGDIVLCETKFGVCLGKIIDIPEQESCYTGELKHVIQRMDLDYMIHDKLKAIRVAEIKAELENMRRKMENKVFYAMLAEKMPEAKGLIDELANLE